MVVRLYSLKNNSKRSALAYRDGSVVKINQSSSGGSISGGSQLPVALAPGISDTLFWSVNTSSPHTHNIHRDTQAYT